MKAVRIPLAVVLASALFNQLSVGNIVFQLKEVYDCKNPDNYPFKALGNKIRKYNRTTFTYSTDLVFPDVVNDDIKFTIRLAIFGNGGWKNNYFVMPLGGICTAFRRYSPKLWDVVEESAKHRCPIPAGNYTIKDMVTTTDIIWPTIVFGTYKVTAEGSQMNRMVFCKIFLVKISPKRIGA